MCEFFWQDDNWYRGFLVYARGRGLYLVTPFAGPRPSVLTAEAKALEDRRMAEFEAKLRASIKMTGGRRLIREIDDQGGNIRTLIRDFKDRHNLPGISPLDIAA